MYEHRNQPLVSRAAFMGRFARHAALAIGIVAGVLFVPIFHRIPHRFHLSLEEGDQ